MLPFHVAEPQGRPLEVLLLGAHCDDIEIGCGGTVLRLVEMFPNAVFHWVVLSSNAERGAEARHCAADFLDGRAEHEIVIKEFRESYFPWIGGDIKDFFEQLRTRVDPDVIFTHFRGDLHQDHRLVSDLTWNTFRNHLILEYEIPKYDGDLGSPNLYVALSEAGATRKVQAILKHHKSQRSRQWFDESTFWSIMRLRGMECNARERFAEGFYCRKSVL